MSLASPEVILITTAVRTVPKPEALNPQDQEIWELLKRMPRRLLVLPEA